MIELKSSTGEKGETDMVDLFSIDGTVYQMPAKPKANVALQYLMDLRDAGPLIAEARLMERLIGFEGFKALATFQDLEQDDLRKIQEEAARRALGALEDTSGNAGSGTSS